MKRFTGVNPIRDRHTVRMQIDRIFIHVIDTPNGRWHTAEDVDVWHGERRTPFRRTKANRQRFNSHLKHIGYHFLIRLDGVIETGRAIDERGAHVSGFNDRALGIALVGRDRFTAVQWQSLEQLVDELIQIYPTADVLGHEQHGQGKTCPNFSVSNWLARRFWPLEQHILISKEHPKWNRSRKKYTGVWSKLRHRLGFF